MKRELTVSAHRTVTEFDRHGSLLSTVELRVPAEELEYMGEVLQAQDREKDVRCTLIVRTKTDGEPRRLALNLKNSKMKDFVPVAIFTKFGVTSDNLTQLFDTGWYGGHELLLVVEVIECTEAEPLDFEQELRTPTWVLDELRQDALACERMLGEGGPHCPDAFLPGNEAYERVAARVAAANADEVYALLLDVTIDPTDWDDPNSTPEADLIDMRRTLLWHWELVAALEAEPASVPVGLEPSQPGEDLPFPIGAAG